MRPIVDMHRSAGKSFEKGIIPSMSIRKWHLIGMTVVSQLRALDNRSEGLVA